jgi:hypothetical protein
MKIEENRLSTGIKCFLHVVIEQFFFCQGPCLDQNVMNILRRMARSVTP